MSAVAHVICEQDEAAHESFLKSELYQHLKAVFPATVADEDMSDEVRQQSLELCTLLLELLSVELPSSPPH